MSGTTIALIAVGVCLAGIAAMVALGGLTAVGGLAVYFGQRKFGRDEDDATPVAVSHDHAGCNCNTAKAPDCVPARVCLPKTREPIAIVGTTCDPTDRTAPYHPQVQTLVSHWAKQLEDQSVAESMESVGKVLEDYNAQYEVA